MSDEMIVIPKGDFMDQLKSIISETVKSEISTIKIPEVIQDKPDYIDTNEAMKYLNCSKTKLWYLRKGIRKDQDQNGNVIETKVKPLPFYRSGKKVLYKLEDLRDYIEN